MTEPWTRQPVDRQPRDHGRVTVAAVSRVALPGVGFWLAKGLSTAMGEAVSDWSVNAWVSELAVLVGFVAFAVALAVQLRQRSFRPWAYWTAVAMVGIFGTMAADVAHVVLHAPYVVSFVGYGGLLGLLFLVWRRREGTVDVHEITTLPRECFYWGAVVLTFAMGTALGDLTAVTLHIGYLGSALLFAVLIAIPAFGYRFLSWNAVACFWAAYTVTRPLGASVADWLGKPTADGGLGIGSGLVGAILALAMAVVVAVLSTRPVSSGTRRGRGRGGWDR